VGVGFSADTAYVFVGENTIKKIWPTSKDNAIDPKIDFFQTNLRP
jgi:hypothetical protein